MSKKIIAGKGQTIIDVALLHCGNVDRMIDIVAANEIVTVNDLTGKEIDLAEALQPGLELELQDEWIEKKIVNEMSGGLATAQ